ncbi:MAG: DUF2244 domain-containing protein [Pseudomonadota bacterium]
MLQTIANNGRQDAVFVIQPNRNLSWSSVKLLFLFLALCLAAVAGYFVSLGAWLVVPFAGLELLAIGFGFYFHCCHAHRQQLIRVDADSISITDGREGVQQTCFPRAWSKIVQTRDPEGWYPSRLFIGAHGKFIEIGEYLIESERDTLANNLRCTIQGA